MGCEPSETRELAYKTWRECSQNLSECHRRMNGPLGYVISRQSLHNWKEKYDWEGRAARAEAEEKNMKKASSVDAMLTSLLTQKEKYDTYFKSLPAGKIDNQASYAYSGLLKNIVEISQKSGSFSADMFSRFFRDLVEFLKKNDPEGAETVVRNFDDFTTFVREKYVS